jgi:hypothetical protein
MIMNIEIYVQQFPFRERGESIGEEKGVLARFVFYSPIFRMSKKRRIT